MNTSPYMPPQSDLTLPEETVEGEGSVDDAIAGHYDFSVGEIIAEAWQRIDGYKMPFAVVSTAYILIYMAVLVPVSMLLGKEPSAQVLSQLVSLLFVPMGAALMMTGIHMAIGRPVTVGMLFAHYDKLLPLIGLQIVIGLSVLLGFLLLVIPGIYLSVAVMFAMPLMVEKDMSVMEAFSTSRKAVTHHWFRIFGVMLVMGVIVMLSALPLFIGLFWTMPMMMATMGVMYRRMFGVG